MTATITRDGEPMTNSDIWARPEFASFTAAELEQLRQAGLIIAAFANRPGWLADGQRSLDRTRSVLRNATNRGITPTLLASALGQQPETIRALLNQ